MEYQLPATGIRVKFSLVDLNQDVRRRRRFLKGRGVLPDYPVSQSLADFIGNRDAVLQAALQLIQQRAKL
ncbi:MAG: hypothetical protein EOO59_21870 [Hymenobacter sp.]|nr:MAG: hypothetical protein EOO59_21870 [Hymenobacter sp.]